MSREISPLRLGAETFFVSGIQPNLFERALSIREWSSSGRVAYFVPACGPHWPERRSRQLNHRDLWSGRWESNPRPKLGKRENKNRDYVLKNGAAPSGEPVDISSDSQIHFRPRRMAASTRGLRRPSSTESTRSGSSSGA